MSALKKALPLEEETPVKNLSIEIQEEIIWFHRDNRLNQWVVHQPPSITTRGNKFGDKFGLPEPIDWDEWTELDTNIPNTIHQIHHKPITIQNERLKKDRTLRGRNSS